MPQDASRRQAIQWLAGVSAFALTGCSGSAPTGGGGGVIVTPTPNPVPAPTPTPTPIPTLGTPIKTEALNKNMRFGSAVAWSAAGADAGSFANPNYAAMLENDCSVLVPENELKWQAIRPNATTFDFTRADALVAYADSKLMQMRGHTLLWHQRRWMPAWAESHPYGTGAAGVTEATRILTEHIQTVCRRYRGKILSWDVVNEAVDPATGTLYETALSTALGGAQATLDLAFQTAFTEAPGATLVYNDYMGFEGGATHRAGVLALLQGFKARGIPCHALGIQSHLGIYSNTPVATLIANQSPSWRTFLDQVVALGYKLVITEMDVRDDGVTGTIAQRDQAVADYARGYLDLMFTYPALRDVLFWGMCDKYSWLQGFAPRSDGMPQRPNPYSADFAFKPLHTQIRNAFIATTMR